MGFHVWTNVEGGSIAHPILWIQFIIQCFTAGPEIVHTDLAGSLLPHRFRFRGILLFATEEREEEGNGKWRGKGIRGQRWLLFDPDERAVAFKTAKSSQNKNRNNDGTAS